MRAIVTIADPDQINFNSILALKLNEFEAVTQRALNVWGILASHVRDGGTIILRDKYGYPREVRLEDLARD
jgi:hypothetical protein